MTFGVKFSASEVDDAFAEMKIDEVIFFTIAIWKAQFYISLLAGFGNVDDIYRNPNDHTAII